MQNISASDHSSDPEHPNTNHSSEMNDSNNDHLREISAESGTALNENERLGDGSTQLSDQRYKAHFFFHDLMAHDLIPVSIIINPTSHTKDGINAARTVIDVMSTFDSKPRIYNVLGALNDHLKWGELVSGIVI